MAVRATTKYVGTVLGERTGTVRDSDQTLLDPQIAPRLTMRWTVQHPHEDMAQNHERQRLKCRAAAAESTTHARVYDQQSGRQSGRHIGRQIGRHIK